MKAHELISSPDKWTKGVYARDKNHSDGGVYVLDPDAYCFCPLGAILRKHGSSAVGDRNLGVIHDARRLSEYLIASNSITQEGEGAILVWNDAPARQWNEVYSALKALDI